MKKIFIAILSITLIVSGLAIIHTSHSTYELLLKEVSESTFNRLNKVGKYKIESEDIVADATDYTIYTIIDSFSIIKNKKEADIYFKASDGSIAKFNLNSNNIPVEEFIKNYRNEEYFGLGYRQGYKFSYKFYKNKAVPEELKIDDNLLISKETFEALKNKPHVSKSDAFVENIARKIPFEAEDYYFVIDEITRKEGWFIFITRVNGKELYCSYAVNLFYQNETWESLMKKNVTNIQLFDDKITIDTNTNS